MLFTNLSDLSKSASVLGLLGIIGASSLFYVSVIIVYRLWFHPLAKYPGPFLAKVTDSYQAYHAWKGDRHIEFWREHEKYGKFVRFSPNGLSINTNTALNKIYGFNASVRKSKFYSVFPPTKDTFNTHSSIDKAAHGRKRRVLSHAFSDNAIKQMEKYVLSNIRSFCGALGADPIDGMEKKGWTSGRNMADFCNYLTFDIMGDLCFGKAFGMIEKPDNRFAIDLIGNAAHRHLICGTNPIIHHLHLDKVLFPKISSGRERYIKFSKAQALERMKLGDDSDRRDFFYYLLKAKDPETGAGFSMPELWGESNLLIIAGSDTTSTALAASFFHLTHNDSALQEVTREIRDTFADADEIQAGTKLSACTYLRAVIDESMRLSPPVGGLLPREVLGDGIVVDGESLPAGVVVGTPHYAVHHNPSYFPSPFTFNPSRWIIDSSPATTADSVALARSAFCPFSIGPRGCIGKGMAYTELGTALARTLWLYDMRLSPGTKVGEGHRGLEFGRHRTTEYQLRDSFTSLKNGPIVEFRRR